MVVIIQIEVGTLKPAEISPLPPFLKGLVRVVLIVPIILSKKILCQGRPEILTFEGYKIEEGSQKYRYNQYTFPPPPF